MAEKTARYLAIETSSRRLSIALGDEQKVLAVYRSPLEWRHAETLFAALERSLKKMGWKPIQLTGVAASLGPGSFTGIRIGLAVARTLGQTLKIPVVGVSSLKTMAYGAAYKTSPFVKGGRGGFRSTANPPIPLLQRGGYYTPEIDAFSGKIFTALFEVSPKGDLKRVIAETHTTAEDWQRQLKARHVKPQRITTEPDAADLLVLARPQLQRAKVDSYRKVLPLYLRQPAAQERRKKK